MRRELDDMADPVDSLVLADREDELSGWLAEHGVEREWLLAPPLAAAGADVAWCNRLSGVLEGPALAAGVEWVAHSVAISGLLDEVKDSTRRVSDLVRRVRSYTQLDRASLQRTDIPEGLDSTVVMLAHKLGDGVVVERDYSPDVPRIEAMAAELNQVWTNLIDNAVQAMGGEGTLTIRTYREDDCAVIGIGDTGPGVPDEIVGRIFEPFFTTKPVGEGTGLGLDISWRIVVKKHHGDIRVESRPGDTWFLVRLPLTPADDAPVLGRSEGIDD
jgi:signal transduction histidine kinase